MHLKTYDFSGIRLGIESENPLSDNAELRKFSYDGTPDYTISLHFTDTVPDTSDCADYFVKTAKLEANMPERPFSCTEFYADRCEMQVLDRYAADFTVDSTLRHLPLSHMLLKFDAFVLHGAYILVNGEAVIFSAPSGTGKSTQAELWRRHRSAAVINGDRVLVRKGADGFTAGGIYFAGTSGICENVTAPLRAIVVLGQAKQNSLRRCTGSQALHSLFGQSACCDIDGEPVRLVGLMSELINSTEILKLDCLPDVSAVEMLSDFLYGESK